MFFPNVTILGVGLIGASVALAMKKRGLCGHITGFGRREESLMRAKELGIVDSFDLDPSRASRGSDFVLFSLPVGLFAAIARTIKDSLKEGAVVSDAGSIKGGLVHEMENILSKKTPFVGAHPIAGSEQSGIDAASADLFDKRRCVITPTDRTERAALDTVTGLWRSLGADVVTMTPREHDRVFGAVSHLPHIIAYELMNSVDELNHSYLAYAGQGFLDTTRIAASSPEVWRDICMGNRENLVQFLDTFMARLERVKGYLISADAASLERDFGQAKKMRDESGQD
jgi:prephenate dehydrogenase